MSYLTFRITVFCGAYLLGILAGVFLLVTLFIVRHWLVPRFVYIAEPEPFTKKTSAQLAQIVESWARKNG